MVLGHADYYPRFGFRQATEFGVHHPQYDGPNLMALALDGARRTGRRSPTYPVTDLTQPPGPSEAVLQPPAARAAVGVERSTRSTAGES